MKPLICVLMAMMFAAPFFAFSQEHAGSPSIYFYDYTFGRKLRLFVAPLSDPTLWLTSARAYKFVISDKNMDEICQRVSNGEGQIGLSIKDDIILLVPHANCEPVSSSGDSSEWTLPSFDLRDLNLPSSDLSKLDLQDEELAFEQKDNVFISPEQYIQRNQQGQKGDPIITWDSRGGDLYSPAIPGLR